MKDQRVITLSNWRSTLVPQPATPHVTWLSATICWPTSDRPHKVNDRSHEVTDWPHQACIEAFNLSNGNLVPSHPHWIKWVCILISSPPPQLFAILRTRKLVNVNTCLESAYARSPPYPSGWPYQNIGQYQRSELFWSLSGTHTLLFFRLPCHRCVQQLFNPVNVLISKFFTGQTGWLTDGQNRFLNPFAHAHTV